MTKVCFHRRDDCQDGTVRGTSDAHNVPGLCLIWLVPRITDPKNDVVVGSEGDVAATVAEPSLNVRVHALDSDRASDELDVGLRHPEIDSMPRVEGDRVRSGPEHSLAVDQAVSKREKPHVLGGRLISPIGRGAGGCAQKPGIRIDRDPVDRADQVCPLKNVAPREQIVAAHHHIRFSCATYQGALVVQQNEPRNVLVCVSVGNLVKQIAARHWNHPSGTVEGIQVAALGDDCTPIGAAGCVVTGSVRGMAGSAARRRASGTSTGQPRNPAGPSTAGRTQ